jgi:hypothetical protein
MLYGEWCQGRRQMDDLDNIFWDASASQRKRKPFGRQRCLRWWFEENRIACQDKLCLINWCARRTMLGTSCLPAIIAGRTELMDTRYGKLLKMNLYSNFSINKERTSMELSLEWHLAGCVWYIAWTQVYLCQWDERLPGRTPQWIAYSWHGRESRESLLHSELPDWRKQTSEVLRKIRKITHLPAHLRC